jgi:hypothetical protein
VNDFVATFEKTFRVQKTWARAGSLTWVFAEMAEEAYDNYLLADEEKKKRKKRQPKPPADEYSVESMELDSRLTKLGIKSIVFTAMALEAGVFELAAINLDDKDTNALDKLNLEGKWLIVPQMICGRSLSDEPTLNGLHSLTIARNKLVHNKSESAGGYQFRPGHEGDFDAKSGPRWTIESMTKLNTAIKKMDALEKKFHSAAKASFKTLIRISLELEGLIGNTGPLPQFSEDTTDSDDSDRSRSPLLTKAISDCKTSLQNKQKKHEKA